MEKKKLLCGTLLAGALVCMTGCSNYEEFDALSRDNFAENVHQKDSSQFIQFNFNSLTETEMTELESFRELSKSIATSRFDGNNEAMTRIVTGVNKIDTSDMDQSSPLVKIMNAMSDPEVASALQNKDVNRFLSLLKQKSVLSINQETRAVQNIASIQQGEQFSIFFIYGALVAVVAAAYAAVVADVIVLGPTSAANSSVLPLKTMANEGVISLNLGNISNDKESNRLIDNTISEVLYDESTENVVLVQNIAKSVYNEYQ
ncbi:MAG: hypothetical protein IJB28_00670 [Bacteroidaceae bacterium]|nr:hypothetical protein [Bacteroidaceae bacterium]